MSKVKSKTTSKLKITPVKMNDLEFQSELFEPMPTNTKIDDWLSSQGGIMPGTNTVVTGDPGVGKTTVLLDIISELQKQGKKVLFISGEMNAIDMYGYVKRYPKFGKLDILFMGEYADENPEVVINEALKPGYDVVLVDSMIEVADMFVDYNGGTNKGASTRLLSLFEKHNRALNDGKVHTAFLIVQQVTKSGGFAGSNKIKHMTTGMMHMKINTDLTRYIYFSKNRRGGKQSKLYFDLNQRNSVEWLMEEEK